VSPLQTFFTFIQFRRKPLTVYLNKTSRFLLHVRVQYQAMESDETVTITRTKAIVNAASAVSHCFLLVWQLSVYDFYIK